MSTDDTERRSDASAINSTATEQGPSDDEPAFVPNYDPMFRKTDDMFGGVGSRAKRD